MNVLFHIQLPYEDLRIIWLSVRTSYRASGYNLRLVQKQFGHAYVATTQVYADVTEPDVHCRSRLEAVVLGDPLIMSSNTRSHMSTRALEKAFKRTAARAGLPSHYSIHCLRHTYACELYRASGYNLRLVQKQLGYAHVATTQVYADVMEPDVQWALDRLYKAMRKQSKGSLKQIPVNEGERADMVVRRNLY